jgi:hypothetical protein
MVLEWSRYGDCSVFDGYILTEIVIGAFWMFDKVLRVSCHVCKIVFVYTSLSLEYKKVFFGFWIGSEG